MTEAQFLMHVTLLLHHSYPTLYMYFGIISFTCILFLKIYSICFVCVLSVF